MRGKTYGHNDYVGSVATLPMDVLLWIQRWYHSNLGCSWHAFRGVYQFGAFCYHHAPTYIARVLLPLNENRGVRTRLIYIHIDPG